MYEIGELIRWRSPLDEDYSYGYIVNVEKNYVLVRGTGYYKDSLTLIHIRYIEQRGGDSDGWGKKHIK